MKKSAFLIGFICCFWLWVAPAAGQQVQKYKQMQEEIAQKQKSTRAKIEELNQQIRKYEERLKLATQKYEELYQQYQDLKKLIALQDEKLSKLQQEQDQIQEEINVTTRSLEEKKKELQQLVEDYKKTLGYLYKHGRTSQLALIFSSSSINQMLVRAFYLEKFNQFREQQAREIKKAEQELERTKQNLIEARSKNEEVLAKIQEEKQDLAEKRKQQAKNVALLRKNKEQIQQHLQTTQQQVNNLENMLASYEAREKEIEQEIIEAQKADIRRRELERRQNLKEAQKIKNDAERAREVAKYSKPIDRSELLDESSLDKIEETFADSKGRLPWPVKSHTISEHFGPRRHPVYGTVTPNPGIEIVTEPQAKVKVVHPGFVVDVRPLPGYGNVVVVKHGRFYTVYGNLSEINVQKNQVLQEGDIIGLSGTPNSIRGESLFFLIREHNQNLDPENWLQTQTVSSNY